MTTRSVLISGAGIAGTALAHWLHAHGFTPTIVERAAGPRSGGHTVDVRGTARKVIDRMGLRAQVQAAHTGARGMAFVDARSRPLATLDTEVYGHSGGPIAELAVRRTDLARILAGATAHAAEFRFDDSIAAVEQSADGVHVRFESGATGTYDLLVGADGVHSRVRRLVPGDHPSFVHDLGCAMALFTMPSEVDLGGRQLMHTVAGAPGRPGRTAALAPVPEKGRAQAAFFWRSDAAESDGRDRAAWMDAVERTFAGDAWEVPGMLAAMADAPDFYADEAVQIVLPTWSQDRTVLVGDAAWCASPMSGIGTSLALVGAYVLAHELGAAAGDHRVALPAYERAMRPFVESAQSFARGSRDGGLMPPTSWHLWLRNLSVRLTPLLPRTLVARGMERVATTVTLPDSAALAGAVR